LTHLLDRNTDMRIETVREAVGAAVQLPSVREVEIREVDLALYDHLLLGEGVR
jgi:hypothetical protein